MQSGGDLNARDGDGYTPLSILNEDREKIKSSLGKWSHCIDMREAVIVLSHVYYRACVVE